MRHKKVAKRETAQDSIYKSRLVGKFINNLMTDGKKTVAQRVFYDAMDIIEQKGQKPLEVFEKAVQSVAPRQEVKARRVGGASYQVPIEVRGDRKITLAIRWLIEAAKARSSSEYHRFSEKLAAELFDAIQNQGAAVKKRDTMHRSAEANKAFAHFKW